jgi:hypothetical protein
MAQVEQALREQPELLAELAAVHARRDVGVHGLGEIWRAHRLSCPSREQLGSYLLGVLDEAAADYVTFHRDVIGCRYCQANLADLQHEQSSQRVSRDRRGRAIAAGDISRAAWDI